MLYFKAKVGGVQDYWTGYKLIKNELLTSDERRRKYPKLSPTLFEYVDIPEENTYWLSFLGCRFEEGSEF